MTNEQDGLLISPSELKFRFQLGKTIPTQIILYNPTAERYAFKVKTTSPKKYCVRPSSGFVEPQSNRHVEVIMQCQKEYPTDLGNCKDKFLLQSVAAPGDERDVTPAMFEKGKGRDVKESKLKVLLEGPPAPPSPIREERTEVPEEGAEVNKVGKTGSAELQKLKRERDELRRQLDTLKNEAGAGRPLASQVLSKGGFTMLHLILAAVIAFLLGHYTS
ncbi:hypothetical protein BSKO_10753 [Bryopsis sp. KO-2023]|nr:hypothetical protein BSKO_10753 [Bryopsis sp. KO-2023]